MSLLPIFTALLMIEEEENYLFEQRMRQMRLEREKENRRRTHEYERVREEDKEDMIKFRKNAPVVYNNERWQRDRCAKAMSLQPCIQELISVIESLKLQVIEREKHIFNQNILEIGTEYERVRQEIEEDISTLKDMGITVTGNEYALTRIKPSSSKVIKPELAMEALGKTFIIRNGTPIVFDSSILSDKGYFDKKYLDMNPEEIERDFNETTKRMKRYQLLGKYLKFILESDKYLDLKYHSRSITRKHEECELVKGQMQSYRLYDQKRLLAVKTYLVHLNKLYELSQQTNELFSSKGYLIHEYMSYKFYDLTFEEIMSSDEYSELLNQVYEYVNRLISNDEETMKEAYELVKGEYPIKIDNRYVYSLIIENADNYKVEKPRVLGLKNNNN